MAWTDAVRGMLGRYDGKVGNETPSSVNEDYDVVANNAPPQVLAQGLNHTFNSDQTPPFGQMVSQLFGRRNGQQKAGLLNTLLAAVGGASGSSTLPALAGILGRLNGGTVSSIQADQIPQEHVEQIAEHAAQKNPAIVEQVSHFYAQHPQLVKTLGAAALTVFMARLANQNHVM